MREQLKFLLSAIKRDGCLHADDYVTEWIRNQKESISVKVEISHFSEMENWTCDSKSFRHATGRFFSIQGIKVKTDWFSGGMTSWCQPIINQPEIGYLGFIVKEINGVFHFLVQAKVEPGNVNAVQLSPTLQATKSNYQKVHSGKSPAYLDYFKNARPEHILLDQLQSEQGGRFLKKRNRNIIIQVEDDLVVRENFIWLTLLQLKELMKIDNLVNMDSRTVISGLSFGTYNHQVRSYFQTQFGLSHFGQCLLNSYSNADVGDTFEVLSHLTTLKSQYELDIQNIDLNQVENWIMTDSRMYHEDRRYFEVLPVKVSIDNREVTSWHQPMISPLQEGLCAVVCQIIDGVVYLILQAKLECGNHDILEFAPTVQTLLGNYKEVNEHNIPFLYQVLNAPSESIYFNSLQSEEGGRFYKEQNRNMVIVDERNEFIELPQNFYYFSLGQAV